MTGDWHPQWILLLGTMYAMVLGGAIGFEREMKDRPAGFRTHMLVSGAASLLVGLGPLILADPAFAGRASFLRLDPIRLVEATITGVAFIGAGTIFSHRSKEHVAGITTAASLLMVAVIGIVVALRYYLLALLVSAMTLLVLLGLTWVEKKFRRND
ncbi:MgtC/SapB family protein [Lysobacter sp. A6]|uniref:Protein MgtC n=1 Tax=Noviluteimonas lactosilytica TaxID=2888523 RepID=A0ABS8JI18_9GAMM|nr:MgtC/SapB family protein [Lysobacter lactosilyticus]MCC8363252.1 MgtC/SapB family protein [Lysobacter lactosilyticus]